MGLPQPVHAGWIRQYVHIRYSRQWCWVPPFAFVSAEMPAAFDQHHSRTNLRLIRPGRCEATLLGNLRELDPAIGGHCGVWFGGQEGG